MTGDLRKEYEQQVKRLVKEAQQQLQHERPEFAQFKLRNEVTAYRKPPKGFWEHPERIVKGWLTNTPFLNMTNSQVVRTVEEWYPHYKVSESIMTRPLSKKMVDAVQALLTSHGLSIKVRPDHTLSKLKMLIRARGETQGDTKSKTVTVQIGSEHVVVDGEVYLVDPSRKDPSIRVPLEGGKRVYVRCDALATLLRFS